MTDFPLLNFSCNADHIAYSDPTGTIKIWNTLSGSLQQEYAPSSHLSVSCTCISWCPKSSLITNKDSPHKKKRKINNQSINLDLIAFGTSSGTILLYSSRQSELCSQLTHGHTDKVTGICWTEDGNGLFSCSLDRQIIHWDVNNAKQIYRWSSDQELHSIYLCRSQTHLLTAAHNIQLWDLESHKVLQTFLGHTTDVHQLIEVEASRNKQVTNGESHNCVEGNYIVSAAVQENKISVRQIGTKSKVTDITASFLLSDEPYLISINRESNNNRPFQMIVVTRLGHLSYFECQLNGRQKKPFKALHTTRIVTNEKSSRTLPITAAAFTNSGDNIIIAYEDFLRPVFEKIKVSDLKETLMRENPKKCKLSKQETVSKVKYPTISNDIKVIAGANVPITAGPSSTSTKKRKKSFSLEELPLGERGVSKLASTVANLGSQSETNMHGFCVLLTQGLQSGDKQMINNVLQRHDENTIRSTISNLSLPSIELLATELQRRVAGHAANGRLAIKWLKILIEIHSSYLLMLPKVGEFLSNMIWTLDTPTVVLNKLLQLKGKLDAVVSQMSSRNNLSHVYKPALFEISAATADDELIVEDVRHIEEDETNWSENEELEPLNNDITNIYSENTNDHLNDNNMDESLSESDD